MVATQQADYFAFALPIGDALTHPLVLLFRSGFNAFIKRCIFLRLIVDGAFVKCVDDVFAQRCQLIVQFAELLGEFVHPDAFLPQVGIVVVAKVHLHGCFHDGGGSVHCATVVAGSQFPFHRNDYDLCLFGSAWQTVDARIGYSGCVGVKSVFHSVCSRCAKIQLLSNPCKFSTKFLKCVKLWNWFHNFPHFIK